MARKTARQPIEEKGKDGEERGDYKPQIQKRGLQPPKKSPGAQRQKEGTTDPPTQRGDYQTPRKTPDRQSKPLKKKRK